LVVYLILQSYEKVSKEPKKNAIFLCSFERCLHHNSHSIGVCYEGGLDARGQPADTRTPEQKVALRQLLEDLHRRYPRALIVGHHDLDPTKDCPCIKDVVAEYKDLQP